MKKDKIQDLIKTAEDQSKKTEINDQVKYLVDQKIDVLRTLN
jgi:F-type H+-transporting ATPase subunit epsilon/F-type H+-transporting ATPase subunit delta